MTESEANGRYPLSRGKLLIALFVTAAVLASGAHALVPAPAAAVMDDGGEPCDPNSPADCEPDKGAGSGTDSGGGTVTAGTYRRPGEGLPSEPIHTEGTAPKQSTVPRSSEVGGRRGPGRDDGRSARAPRPRGRRTVIRAPRGDWWPTLGQCRMLKSGELVLQSEVRKDALQAQLDGLWKELEPKYAERFQLERRQKLLVEDVSRLQLRGGMDLEISIINRELAPVVNSLDALKEEMGPLVSQYEAVQDAIFSSPATDQRHAMSERCRELYDI